MPFRDKHWEDLRRDCDIFPAYSDYLYGPDDRLVVTQEPGLHPLIYPAYPPQTIRYTNSTPSRSGSYKTTGGRKQPSSTGHMVQALRRDCVAEGPSPDSGQFTTMGGIGTYVPKCPTGDTLLIPSPPQDVNAVYEKKNAISQALTRSHEPGSTTSTILQSTSPGSEKVSRRQSQAMNPTKHSTAATQPPQPSYLRSSSTMDIDENPAHAVAFHKPNTSSLSASLSAIYPHTIDVPVQHSEDHLAKPSRYSPHLDLVSHQTSSASPPGPASNIPMLKPDDILGDPRYLLIQPDKLQQLLAYLSEHWGVANNALDWEERAKALINIQNVSDKMHNKLKHVEMEAEQRKQQAQQDQVRRYQGTPGLMGEQMNSYHLHQANQQQHLQHMQRSQQLCSQSQPAFSAPQTPSPHQTIYQSPEQSTQSPYYSIPQSPHPQSQQLQPHMAGGHLLSQTHLPSPQQPQISPAQQPQASVHLRANINRHIPKLWHCLRLVKQAPELLSEAAMADQRAAHQWLTSFKQSLPPEGHRYMVQVVNWMYRESSAGRDPLASMGHIS